MQGVYLKTNESVALPVYNALPDAAEDKKAREEEAAAREAAKAKRAAERDE